MEDEFFPILIKGDTLAVKAPPEKVNQSKPEPVPLEPKEQLVEQVAEPKPVRKVRLSGLKTKLSTGMVSVKSMLEDEGEKKEEEIEDFSDRPRTPFTEDEFKVKWEAYIQQLKKDKRASLASTLASCHPEVEDNFQLNMVFDNIVQESEFINEKTALLGFLRESLNNWGIQIKTEVRIEEQKKKYYTNKERFERMMELNPKLEELRKRLNIDPDF